MDAALSRKLRCRPTSVELLQCSDDCSSVVSSDAGLLAYRELVAALGLSASAGESGSGAARSKGESYGESRLSLGKRKKAVLVGIFVGVTEMKHETVAVGVVEKRHVTDAGIQRLRKVYAQ